MFPPLGETSAFWRRHQLRWRVNLRVLQLVERGTGEEKWAQAVPASMVPDLAFQSPPPTQLLVPLFTLRDFAVLPLGPVLLGIDAVQGKTVWQRTLALGSVRTDLVPVTAAVLDPLDNTLLVTYESGWVQRLGRAPATYESICVPTPEGMEGIDPFTGKTLWTRLDVQPAMHCFGDDEYLFLVARSVPGQPGGALAVRRLDGRRAAVANFSDLYQRHIGQHGRSLLLRDPGEAGKIILRLHDVLAGKDVWSKSFPPETVIASSTNPGLTAAVQPDGKVLVLDVASGKRILETELKIQQRKDLEGLTLLADEEFVFLALRNKNEPAMVASSLTSNLAPALGLTSVPINGDLIALDRTTGKTRWYLAMPNQTVLVDLLAELPVIVLTSRYQVMINQGGNFVPQMVTALQIVEKATGKRVYDARMNNEAFIHALEVDPAKSRLGIVTFQERINVQAKTEK